MAVSPRAYCFAQFFKITLEILSGPKAFVILLSFSSFEIPGTVTFNAGIVKLKHFLKVGRVLFPNVVKVE